MKPTSPRIIFSSSRINKFLKKNKFYSKLYQNILEKKQTSEMRLRWLNIIMNDVIFVKKI